MSRGIIAIGIDKDDELVAAHLTDGNQIVFLASHEGQAIRFDEEDVRPMGRPAYGVRGMDLDKGDYTVGMAVTPKPGKAPVAPSIQQKVDEVIAAPSSDAKADGKSAAKDAKPAGKDRKDTKDAKPDKPVADKKTSEAEEHPNLILSDTENGYAERTRLDEHRRHW